jgi:hypothetical protein
VNLIYLLLIKIIYDINAKNNIPETIKVYLLFIVTHLTESLWPKYELINLKVSKLQILILVS